MLKNLWNDESGVIISAELVLVLTIAVICLVVGLSEVAVAVNTELNDISNAIGSLDQSFGYSSFHSFHDDGSKEGFKNHACGGIFVDTRDDCDKNTSCDLVCCEPTSSCNG